MLVAKNNTKGSCLYACCDVGVSAGYELVFCTSFVVVVRNARAMKPLCDVNGNYTFDSQKIPVLGDSL